MFYKDGWTNDVVVRIYKDGWMGRTTLFYKERCFIRMDGRTTLFYKDGWMDGRRCFIRMGGWTDDVVL